MHFPILFCMFYLLCDLGFPCDVRNNQLLTRVCFSVSDPHRWRENRVSEGFRTPIFIIFIKIVPLFPGSPRPWVGGAAASPFLSKGRDAQKNWTRRTWEFVERILDPASAPEQRTEWVNAVFDLWIPHPFPPITFAGDTKYAMLYELYFYNHSVISIFFSFKQLQSLLTFGSCRVSPKDWLPQMGRWPRITFLGPKHVSLLPVYFQVTMLFLFWCFSVFDKKKFKLKTGDRKFQSSESNFWSLYKI